MLYTMLIYQAGDVAAAVTDDDQQACYAGHRALQKRSKAGNVFRDGGSHVQPVVGLTP